MHSWTRRQFLAVSSAAALRAGSGTSLLGQALSAKPPTPAPIDEVSAGRLNGVVTPLLINNTARPLRYQPVRGEFLIHNGKELFNRPIYGPLSDFRVDAGDLPEFSLYMPGHGGNLKLGIVEAAGSGPANKPHPAQQPATPSARTTTRSLHPYTAHAGASHAAGVHPTAKPPAPAPQPDSPAPPPIVPRAKWLSDADDIIARYRPGRMIYEIRDALLGSGVLTLELVTASVGSGLLLKVEAKGLSAPVSLVWAFAGSSGRKGRKKGDIGCEDQPVSQFFKVRAEECAGNLYALESTTAGGVTLPAVRQRSTIAEQVITFPAGAALQVTEFSRWLLPPSLAIPEATATAVPQPMLLASIPLGNAPLILRMQRVKSEKPLTIDPPATEFDARGRELDAIAAGLTIETPDEFFNTAVPALAIATEALWDNKIGAIMHGAVAWRVAIVGWRGPYALDSLGDHERSRENLRHWLRFQNVKPITTDDPALGPYDPNSELSRKEDLLHSNGDLSSSHYDMNHVFFNVLLRHLRWTGDIGFAKEIWPAYKRYIAWERRLFRRIYTLPFGEHAPLYEAYGATWASDDLEGNGGGATYASAYQLMALRFALQLTDVFREDPTPYLREVSLLQRGMQELLWLPQQGIFAESRDLLGSQAVYNNPALWTVYHAIDSEAVTPRQAWQMIAERLHTQRRIPIHGPGVPAGPWFLLSTSNWLPNDATLNTLAMAESAHMALAMWQANMPEEAFALLKGTLLDSMYQGLCPGNFHMTSELDVYRQEEQRDFADPIGITSRALVEGLFGVRPDLIRDAITLAPGFPREWNRATMHHKDFDFVWERSGLHETYEFTSRFAGAVPVTLRVPARTTTWPTVNNGTEEVRFALDSNAVGLPIITIEMPAVPTFKLTIDWHGEPPVAIPAFRKYRTGVALDLPAGVTQSEIEDPQHCLVDGKTYAHGVHTVFANVHDSNCKWSLPITFEVSADSSLYPPVPKVAFNEHTEAVDLSNYLLHQLTQIFARGYVEPRPATCSLAVPQTLLGGWTVPLEPIAIDDAGLRKAGGILDTGVGVPFRTPAGSDPNCRFLSFFKPDQSVLTIPLTGSAAGIYFLLTGTTLPQFSHMDHVLLTVTYADGKVDRLPLRNPENWWPIEQDYLLDDYQFIDEAPLPPRIDLKTGKTRLLELSTFKGKGRHVPGGAATITYMPLDPAKKLASVKVEVLLYGIVVALLGTTLIRPAA